MYLSNRNWHESPTELKLNPHPYLIVFATQYLCYTIIINEVTFTKCRNVIICFYWLLVLRARYQAAFAADQRSRKAKYSAWSAASEAERLSEACFERGFRPACEVETGAFDPRTTFCRPVSRSPSTNERPCPGLLPREDCYKQPSVRQS